MIRFLNDEAIAAAIRNGGTERQAGLRALYDDKELRSKVFAHVRNHHGNQEDGQDIWQEALIVLDRNVREGKFRQETSVKGYLFSICRFLWMNQLRKKAHTTLVEDIPRYEQPDPETPELTLLDEERKSVLNRLLESLGERCRKILELWKLSFSMEEIAEQLGYSSPGMARKAKYRCQQSLLELIQQSPQMAKWLNG